MLFKRDRLSAADPFPPQRPRTPHTMLKLTIFAVCAVQLATASDPRIQSTSDGELVAEDKYGKVGFGLSFSLPFSLFPPPTHDGTFLRPPLVCRGCGCGLRAYDRACTGVVRVK